MKSKWTLWLFVISSFLLSGCDGGGGGGGGTSTKATALESISITPAASELPAGLSQQLTAMGAYSDGSSQDITAFVSWESASPDVATVDLAGITTAVVPGESQVTARMGDIAATATVTVTAAVLQNIAIGPDAPSIPAGLSQALTATGLYSDGSAHDLTTMVIWTSDDPAVATVNESGVANAVHEGTTSVMASAGDISGAAVLTVTPAVLQSITVAPGNKKLPMGLNLQFAATGTFSDGTMIDITDQVTWASSDDVTAFVDDAGLATAVALGSAQISASREDFTGTATLTVTPAILVSIAVLPTDPTISVGETLQFAAVGTYSDASTEDISDVVSWRSASNPIATVDGTGLATGQSAGTALIKAFSGSLKGSTTLTVLP